MRTSDKPNMLSYDFFIQKILPFRRNRMLLFQTLVDQIPGPVRILDLGGTVKFWEMSNLTNWHKAQITILNDEMSKTNLTYSHYSCVSGDARNMPQFKNKEFDIVFSNSVIEHVGTHEDQKRMADEVKRVGQRYFIQTPNYFFPLEPHSLIPFIHFLPFALQISLIQIFGFRLRRVASRDEAISLLRQTRLLKERELFSMFEGAVMEKECILGLTKSFILHHGF